MNERGKTKINSDPQIRILPIMNSTRFIIGVALLAGSCTVGPNYHKPAAKVPEQWAEQSVQSRPADTNAISSWWMSFGDPELGSLIARAVRTNLDLRLAEARVRQARAQLGFAEAAYWPVLDASGSYNRQKQSENQPIIGSIPFIDRLPFENNYYQARFDASWEIDLFGGKRRGVEAATADLVALQYGSRDVLISVVSELARNYAVLRGTQAELAIVREQIKSQNETVAILKARLNQGFGTDFDLQRAVALLSTLEAQVPGMETSIRSSAYRIAVLLDQYPGALLEELSSPAALLAAPPTVPPGLPSELLQRRPDIQRAERQLASANARIGQAKAELFPKFFLTGYAGFASINTSDFFSPESRLWSIGPSVQWRIFDAGRVRANVRSQVAAKDQAAIAYEQVVLQALEDVETALYSYAKEQEHRNLLEQTVEANRKSAMIAQQQYEKGLGKYLDFLDAQRSHFAAQDELARSERTLIIDIVALYKALGGGWNVSNASEEMVQRNR